MEIYFILLSVFVCLLVSFLFYFFIFRTIHSLTFRDTVNILYNKNYFTVTDEKKKMNGTNIISIVMLFVCPVVIVPILMSLFLDCFNLSSPSLTAYILYGLFSVLGWLIVFGLIYPICIFNEK